MTLSVSRPTREECEKKGVFLWPVWEKEVSEFPWKYDSEEQCYILSGSAEVKPEGEEPVRFSAGDFVVFPKGLSCVWKIIEPIRKHYTFV